MDLEALMKGMGPMQEAMKKADAERATQTVEGSAGGGAVNIKLRGDLQVENITIAPAAAAASASADDISMLEDLVLAAMNDAMRAYKQRFGATPEEQMQRSMAGSDLSSLFGLG